MSPVQVLGVEVRQFQGGTEAHPVATFVPRVLGQTEEAKQRKDLVPSKAGPIDAEDFYPVRRPGVRT